MEVIIIGSSEDCEAEYGVSMEGYPVTVIQMFDDEIAGWDGATDAKEARATWNNPEAEYLYL